MKCSRCGEKKLRKTVVQHEVQVETARFVGDLFGYRCTACDETEISLSALTRFEHDVARLLAERGPVSGTTMRYMRKSIPMSAGQVAAVLHVAPETVSRWETGERDVDRAAWIVVRDMLL